MEPLNNFPLLHSNIVIGMHAHVNLSLTFTDAFNKWLHYKDTDWGMESLKSRNTLYVGFLHIIDLNILREIFYDLASIYKKQFPYAEKQDFIDYTFGFTIFDLELFISRDLRFLGSPTIDSPFEYYYCFLSPGELIDFAIPKDSSIENYKQYYRKVINLINEIPYNNTSPGPFNNATTKISIVADTSENLEIQTSESDENKFSCLQLATIFYYADAFGLLPEASTKIKRMQQFRKEQNIANTLKYFKTKYYEARDRINNKKDYPIEKLESLIPFLEDNYPKTVSQVQDDLSLLKVEKEETDY